MTVHQNKHGSKIVFVGVIVILILVCASTGFVGYNTTNSLQVKNDKIQSDFQSLNTTYTDLQSNYAASLSHVAAQVNNISKLQSQVNSLGQQIQSLSQQLAEARSTVQSQSATLADKTSQIANLWNQITGLNDTVASLQSQLANATGLIAQLQGQTGILPTYMDLHYVGPTGSPSYYFLQLSLKNTGTVPIKQIFVTLNSVQIPMTFTYLNSTISADTPLPSYQTTNGGQSVTPPINNVGTYPLVIQAWATNSSVYTYQATITTHV